jgi:cytochrome c-type biogenesis protein
VTVSLGLAFAAGLASFLTPCVFSLMPAYIGYLGGRSVSQGDVRAKHSRWNTFLHGAAFVLGFSLVFIGLGLTASVIGRLLYEIRNWLARLGGILIVLFGLQLTGILKIPLLDYELRPQNRVQENRSFLSSLLMGVCFSAGWSPCVGPVLGSILTLAVNEGSLREGFNLLSAYSAGFAIPFLITALGLSWISTRLSSLSRFTRITEIVMGIILIIVGCLLFSGLYEQVAQYGSLVDLDL